MVRANKVTTGGKKLSKEVMTAKLTKKTTKRVQCIHGDKGTKGVDHVLETLHHLSEEIRRISNVMDRLCEQHNSRQTEGDLTSIDLISSDDESSEEHIDTSTTGLNPSTISRSASALERFDLTTAWPRTCCLNELVRIFGTNMKDHDPWVRNVLTDIVSIGRSIGDALNSNTTISTTGKPTAPLSSKEPACEFVLSVIGFVPLEHRKALVCSLVRSGNQMQTLPECRLMHLTLLEDLVALKQRIRMHPEEYEALKQRKEVTNRCVHCHDDNKN